MRDVSNCSNHLTVPKEDAPPPPCTCTVTIVAQEVEEPEHSSIGKKQIFSFIVTSVY